MKKHIFTIAFFVAGAMLLTAQTTHDALTLSQTELTGTARYMGMAGAFGALGADASALKDNPAGLAVYRRSELTTSFNPTFNNNASKWGEKSVLDKRNSYPFNNFTFVMAIPQHGMSSSGLVSSNFSFAYNKSRIFNRSMGAMKADLATSLTDFVADYTTASTETFGTKVVDFDATKTYDPYYNKNIPWLSLMGYHGYLINPPDNTNKNWHSILEKGETVNSNVFVTEVGGINEYTFGWGGNYNNNLFLGATLNLIEVAYKLQSGVHEDFNRKDGGGFDLTNDYTQSGGGVNLKIGAIFLPTNHLRLGVALHTPTFYSIKETTNFNLTISKNLLPKDVADDFKGVYLPDKDYLQEYEFRSPLQFQLSAAYLFGNKGLISAEYNFVNYPNMKYSRDGNDKDYPAENSMMKDVYKNGHVIKLGGEYKVTPNVALRGGYAYYSSPFNSEYQQGKSLSLNSANTHTGYFNQFAKNYITFGAGYRTNSWYFDFAYSTMLTKADYYPYQKLTTMNDGNMKNTLTPVGVGINKHQLTFTIGLRM